jgi:hypothetical protein
MPGEKCPYRINKNNKLLTSQVIKKIFSGLYNFLQIKFRFAAACSLQFSLLNLKFVTSFYRYAYLGKVYKMKGFFAGKSIKKLYV